MADVIRQERGGAFDEMDAAADEAAAELEGLDQQAVQLVAQWWARWYLRTGHKRLGRIMVAKARKFSK